MTTLQLIDRKLDQTIEKIRGCKNPKTFELLNDRALHLLEMKAKYNPWI